MRIVDVGSGPPIVVIPGIQGRWEWMKPGIDALSRRCRVLTFSLADEPGCGARFEPTSGFDCYVEQVREAMDASGLERAAICGVSYGGLIAAAFAARHPERVASLVLVSAIPPSWKPDRRAAFFLRAPTLLSPLFCVASLRNYPEIAAASSGLAAAAVAALRHAWRAITHMFSPERMARRVRLLANLDLRAELAQVVVATLVVTGDARLDRVVPVRLTRQYLDLWPHARVVTIERTGHLGLMTRPEEFTRIV
ncbi:MAG TPA: alpha/beta hydrolase, partial [Vicinamibacterales bacterium]